MELASSYLLCEEETEQVLSFTTATDDWAPHLSCSDDLYLHELLKFERDHFPRADYLSRLKNETVDKSSRKEGIHWIIKVNELYGFRTVTSYLAVNYLDRFLSLHSLPEGTGGWPMQLLSVACVSVAAKMEETRVPLLVDLQSVDATCRFLFEPRTVRRMELLLMSALQWRMHAVTPFDFLPFFASARDLHLLARASRLILYALVEVDFLAYNPSVIAMAALLSAGAGGKIFWSSDISVCEEAVTGCRQLMESYLTDTCPSVLTPPSPIGILDAAACASCDSQKSSAPVTPTADPPPPPPFKRRRIEFVERDCTGGNNNNNTGDDGKDLL